MKVSNANASPDDVPVFAAATGATCYKFGDEGYVDLMFMRPTFIIGEEDATVSGPSHGTMNRVTEMVLKTVSSVTLTEKQARQLIVAIEDQLSKLQGI